MRIYDEKLGGDLADYWHTLLTQERRFYAANSHKYQRIITYSYVNGLVQKLIQEEYLSEIIFTVDTGGGDCLQ